jgi:hypothetical protein
VVLGDLGIEKLAAQRFEAFERALPPALIVTIPLKKLTSEK